MQQAHDMEASGFCRVRLKAAAAALAELDSNMLAWCGEQALHARRLRRRPFGALRGAAVCRRARAVASELSWDALRLFAEIVHGLEAAARNAGLAAKAWTPRGVGCALRRGVTCRSATGIATGGPRASCPRPAGWFRPGR